MHTGADANAGTAKRNITITMRKAFNRMAECAATFAPAAMLFGRTAFIVGTDIRATGLSQIWSEEGVAIPEFGPIDFNMLKMHL
jgi:hypothetical protein